MLTTEQFAAYAPLQTFSVSQGSTPGGIRVRGRELIETMKTGNTAGTFGANNVDGIARVVALNPASFPRLQSYGPLYEFYKFHSAKAIFESNQPTTAGGEAFLACDYDGTDAAPTSSTLMMRNISSSMSHIYAENAAVISGKLSRLPRYITSTVSPIVDDVNQANILYAFEGASGANTTVGYLVVEYDVEFFTPQ